MMGRIGVLALQGAFARHAEVLRALGHTPVLVRDAGDFAALEGLVLPGGESTVQLDLIDRFGLEAPLRELAARDVPVLATCAGLIVLAARVESPVQRSLTLLDVTVQRNAWGRQLDSFEAQADADPTRTLIFIRAPRITRVGPQVQVLARYRGEPVLVRERNLTAAAFHPELSGDPWLHAAVFGEGFARRAASAWQADLT